VYPSSELVDADYVAGGTRHSKRNRCNIVQEEEANEDTTQCDDEDAADSDFDCVDSDYHVCDDDDLLVHDVDADSDDDKARAKCVNPKTACMGFQWRRLRRMQQERDLFIRVTERYSRPTQ
jgi:hypothetical protein